jgi:hypothetical protein
MPLRPNPVGLLGLALLLGSCEHAEVLGPETPAAPTFAAVQEQVFSRSCALSGCHVGASAPLGLDLSAGRAYASTVGVRSMERPDLFRIEPGAPDASYLVKKVQGDPDIVGAQMPLGREPLTAAQIDLLRGWIEEGAVEE